jgi:adenylate cyclase
VATGFLAGIGRLLTGAVVRHLAGDAPLDEAVEEIVLGAPRRYTRVELSEVSGIALDEASRLWRAVGFPEPATTPCCSPTGTSPPSG